MFESSLVQYENPQLVTENSTKLALEEKLKKADKMILPRIDELTAESGIDVMDILMPPRIIEEKGEIWYQKVSRAPASPRDLLNLQDRLDSELVRQGAREIGLCDIRRTLYDQLFDELIRQEIIACPERGRLLRMLRLETALSLKSLLSCYESSIAYGLKKKLSFCAEKADLTKQITDLQSERSELNEIIRKLEPDVAEVKKTLEVKESEKEAEFKAVEAEIEKENESILAFLKGCIKVNIELET